MNGKEISYPTLKQAIYSLTAFLNVRDFFFRFSEDLVVRLLNDQNKWIHTIFRNTCNTQKSKIVIRKSTFRTLGG